VSNNNRATYLDSCTHICAGEPGEQQAPGAAHGGHTTGHPRPDVDFRCSLAGVLWLIFKPAFLFSHVYQSCLASPYTTTLMRASTTASGVGGARAAGGGKSGGYPRLVRSG
jgi:hypothetical protein